MKFFLGLILGALGATIAALIFAKRVKKTRDGLDNVFEAWRLRDKKIQEISFHKFGDKPKDAIKRIYPPPHPGGHPKGKRNSKWADLDDELIMNMNMELDFDAAFESAFWKMRHKYWKRIYPSEEFINPTKLSPYKSKTKRRIRDLLQTKN